MFINKFTISTIWRRIEKVNYYKNDLETLLQGKTSDAEKIAAIYNFVKKKVKWNEYYGKYTDKGVREAEELEIQQIST